MYRAESPFRLAITLLLVAALPICCCNFRLLLDAEDGCHSGSAAATVPEAGNRVRVDVPRSVCCGNAADLAVDQVHATPDQGGDSGKGPVSPDGRCTCDKNKPAAGSIETPPIQSLAVITPVAEIPAIWGVWERPAAPAAMDAGIPRPATALLRMHCALII